MYVLCLNVFLCILQLLLSEILFCPLSSATSTSPFPFSLKISFPIELLTSPKCTELFFFFFFYHSVLCVLHPSPLCRCAPLVWFLKRKEKKNMQVSQVALLATFSAMTLNKRCISLSLHPTPSCCDRYSPLRMVPRSTARSRQKVSLRAYICVYVCVFMEERRKKN